MVESIVTVVLEIVKCLAPPTERQISYLRSYNNNLENLKKEIEGLKGDRESVQHKVDEADGKGERIEKNVQTWLASVDDVIVKAETFVGDEAKASKRCFQGLCPNLKTRHRLSKEAVRQLETLVKLRRERGFDKISYSTAPDVLPLMSGKDYYAFESRMSTLNNILGSLKNPDINMLGIYGMGGIGKTTLAKEVARQARSEKLFDQVVFVEVSQSQDTRKIQGEIAEQLGPTLTEESEPGRASSLFKRMKEKKILVILDNIWDFLDLGAVGIPHGDDHKGCKILLTARREDILLRKMDSRRNFSISVLDEKEAWSLFQRTVGDDIEGSEFESVAKDVAKECAGLPISIVPVAKALRKKRLFEWKDALNKLRRPSTDFKGIQPAAYSAIELSYNALQREELKKIFLLIGYAYMENIDELLMCGMGLGLFQSINKMEEAQVRVRTLIQELKDSSLLLDEDLSMHDVVRDVAIAIASTQQNVFTTINDEMINRWESSDECAVKHYASIVLLDVKTSVLPEELNCPHLEFFYVRATESSSTISDNFFIKMRQIKVLVLKNMNLLPSSLRLLTHLRTLCLYDCKLQDIAGIGGLKKLEIFCLWNREIEQLPLEIGQLTQLKLLDLRECWKLKVIPPNILSNLSHLEELYIGNHGFNGWEEEVEGLKNASLDELKYFPNLTSLELHIKDVNTLPRGLFFKKLERYKIFIGEWQTACMGYSKVFQLKLDTNICLKDGLIVQLRGIEYLRLYGLQKQDVEYFIDEMVKLGSLQLKHLEIEGCDAPSLWESKRCEESTNDILEDDANVPNSFFIEKKWKESRRERQSNEIILEDDVNVPTSLFNNVVAPNLKELKLCNLNIKRIWLFPSSIISSFIQLEDLEIEKCLVLEEIIVVDQKERNDVIFSQLKFLKLRNLPKFTSFFAGDLHVEFPSMKNLEIYGCLEFIEKYKSTTNDLMKKVFPNLEVLGVEAMHMPWICQFPEDFFYKLKGFVVELDESTTILSLDDFLQKLHNVKFLKMAGNQLKYFQDSNENGMTLTITGVNKCCDLEHILKKKSSILDNLEMLLITKCHNLINLVPFSTSFQNLTTLVVMSCKGLRNVLTTSTAKSLMRLREMDINSCNMITEIVVDDEGDNAAKDEIIFSELEVLRLVMLDSVTSFCSGARAFKFPSLETLVVDECPNMKVFSERELWTPKLHKVQIEEFDEESWIWEKDLNTSIQQLYLKKKEADKEESEDEEESDQVHKENNAEASESRIPKEDLSQPSMQHLE